MSSIQPKLFKHAEKQENPTHNEEIYQSIETDSELRQILELADKDFKQRHEYIKIQSQLLEIYNA